MPDQIYEEYWSITNAYTDYNGVKFLKYLEICIEFIERNCGTDYSEEKYNSLQEEIRAFNPINLISIRKWVNQLVKFGFIKPYLAWFHENAKDYLNARTNQKRRSILSKIVYSNSRLGSAVNEESDWKEINFLIKTLTEVGSLSRADIAGLMLVDIGNTEKGYLNREELDRYAALAQLTTPTEPVSFVDRKYNQISHFGNLLGKLEGIKFVRDRLYFEEDAIRIFGDETESTRKKRDSYLHRIYKGQLKQEVQDISGKVGCMVEGRCYPVLIASHIKPFIDSNDQEAYDVNNWFLLSRNIDALFDLWYITFSVTWEIIASRDLDQSVVDYLAWYRLDARFINNARINYLQIHRNQVFERKYTLGQ